jgi:SM-20-related protein
MTSEKNSPIRSDVAATIAAQLAAAPIVVVRDFLPPALIQTLAAEACARYAAGAYHAAAIGHAGGTHARRDIRSDAICWIEAPYSDAVRAYLDAMETLRTALNRELYLGLLDLECHFAVYEPGTFYQRHLDRFAADSRRTVSVVLYLNEGWRDADGGQLRIYHGDAADAAYEEIWPVGGTLVCFLSDRVYHEVLPATRQRLSLTGWLRRRA